ncbi:MAG: hypothetical protein ISQ50_02870 [Synechococcus sp. BS307-5m-G36]|nr:hypothetical protein [Synechococcus sp. BS307-5m-G36]
MGDHVFWDWVIPKIKWDELIGSLLSNAVVPAQILLLPFELFKTESESSFDALSQLGS